MSYKLFLDDIRLPKQVTWKELPLGPWTIVRSYKEFCEVITARGLPDFVTFDHDLSDEQVIDYMTRGRFIGTLNYESYKEKTGLDCAKWLVDYCIDNKKKLPDFVIHSMNFIGAENIRAFFESFKKHQSET